MVTTIVALHALMLGPPLPPDAASTAAFVMKGGCKNERAPERVYVEAILRYEIAAGFPPGARGLALAAACNESGIKPAPEGHADGGRARGMFQFWGWAKRSIKRHGAATDDPRDDWRASARFWIAHLQAQLPKVRRYCRLTGAEAYRAANATAVRSPLIGPDGRARPRCGDTTHHWRMLQSWRQQMTRVAANP